MPGDGRTMRRSPGSHPAARPAPNCDRDFEEVVGVYGGTASLTATLVGASRAGTEHGDQVTRSVESTRWDGNRRTSTFADAPRSRAWLVGVLVFEGLVVGAGRTSQT